MEEKKHSSYFFTVDFSESLRELSFNSCSFAQVLEAELFQHHNFADLYSSITFFALFSKEKSLR